MKEKEITVWTLKNEKTGANRNLILGIEVPGNNRRIIYLQFKDDNGKYRTVYVSNIDYNIEETLKEEPVVTDNDLQWVLENDYKYFDKRDYLKEVVLQLFNEIKDEYDSRSKTSKGNKQPDLVESEER
jgi:hypothetical protein